MTEKLAVQQGCYVDAKFMPGLKVTRVSIDIPIEASNEFLKMFGAPDRANPVHVAIARLGGAQVPEKSEVVAEPEHAKSEAVERKQAFREKPRSSQCFLMLKNAHFISWFADNFLKGVAVNRSEGYEPHVKWFLGVKSKAELDEPGDKADKWDALLTDYEMKDLAR